MSNRPPDEVFDRALPNTFGAWRIGRALQTLWPDLALVEGTQETFELDAFAAAGHCELVPLPGAHLEVHTHWNAPFLDDPIGGWINPFTVAPVKRSDGALSRSIANGVYEARWEGHALQVAVALWSEGSCNHRHWWVFARERGDAEAFMLAVCRFGQAPRAEVLVINGEHWRRDPELYATIRASTMDDLVLPDGFKREIVEDFTTFLASRAQYAELGVPWKRGVLFLGPPGNGKTHCVRAMLSLLDLPVVYVQSFRSRYDTDERNIERVFERARRMAPCALVFEDLDAQVTAANRSFFLNQMDGFAPNAGLLVLATTNHPERLDPAIIDRPSRFDRKYHFELPALADRLAYLTRWCERRAADLRPSAEQLDELAAQTEGFSFAYLKELCLAAALRWMKSRPASGLHPLLTSQLAVLRAQMRTEDAAPAPSEPEGNE